MRSPLCPSRVTGTVVPSSPRPIATRASFASCASSWRSSSGRTRHSGQRTRNIWCRTLQPSSVSGTRGSCMAGWPPRSRPPLYEAGGPEVQNGAFGRFTQALRGRVGISCLFDTESMRSSPPRELPPADRSGLISEDPREPEAPSRLRPRRDRARVGLRRRQRRLGAAPATSGPSRAGRPRGRPGRRLPDQVARPDRGAGHGAGHGRARRRREGRALPGRRPRGPRDACCCGSTPTGTGWRPSGRRPSSSSRGPSRTAPRPT